MSTILFSANVPFTSSASLIRMNGTGQVTFANSSTGTIGIVVDVTGYYSDSSTVTAATRFVPLKQTRIVDTRNAVGVGTKTPVAAGATLPFGVAGKGGLPTVGAISAVALNVTALAPTALGGWTLHPAGSVRPGVSNGNYTAGRASTNSATVHLATDGRASLHNATAGTTHYLVDVVGYYTPAGNTAAQSTRVMPVVPRRVLDSGATPLVAAGASKTLRVAGAGGVPAGVGLVALHVITSGGGTSGELITYPTGDAKPSPASDVAPGANAYSFNLVWARVNSAGDVTITNGTNAGARIYADVQGYAVAPKAPSVPTGVKALPGNTSAAVSWAVPGDDGDLPVASYRIAVSPGDRTVTATSNAVTVTGLTNGQQYTFRVNAVNAAGASPASAMSDPVIPRIPAAPGKPFISDISPRHNAASVSWSSPIGADSVATYKVTASPGGATMTVPGTARTAVLKGLINDTEYNLAVTAVNGNGSAESAPKLVRPRQAEVPQAPIVNVVTPLDGRVDVQWVQPADGGADISGYELVATPGDIVLQIPANTTVAAVTGLTNATAYTFKVRASNIVGAGPQASVASTPTANRAPAEPSNVEVSPAAQGTLAVEWRAPDDPGTAAVTGYTVTVSPGGRVIETTTPSASISGLDPTIEYTVAVAAKNQAGTGTASQRSIPVRPSVVVKKAPVVLSQASLDALTEMSSDGAIGIEQPTPQLSAVVAGDIITGGPSPAAPQGFLKRVERVDNLAGLHVLLTSEAKLTDVLSAGELAGRWQMTDGDVAEFIPSQPGVRLRESKINGKSLRAGATGAKQRGPAGDWTVGLRNGAFVIEVDHEFGGVEGHNVGGVDLKLTASLKPFYEADFDLQSLKSTYDLGVEEQLQFKAYLKARGIKFERSIRLGQVKGLCFTIPIGLMPVRVCPELDVSIKVTADGKASVLVDGQFSKRHGIHIESSDQGTTGSIIQDPVKNDHLRVTPSLSASGRVDLDGRLALIFNGLGGPTTTLSPFIKGEVDVSATPWWEASIGLSIDAGLKFDAFGIHRNWTKEVVTDLELRKWQADKPFLGVVIDPPTAEILGGESVQLRGIIPGFPDEPVMWSLGPHSVGSITSGGLFSAPVGVDGDAKVVAEVAATSAHPELVSDITVRVGSRRPDAVTDVTVAPGDLSATIAWKPPGNSRGTPITQYVVTTEPDTGVRYVPANSTSVTLSGLSADTTYIASITAVNARGNADPSTTEPFVARRAKVNSASATDISLGLGEKPLTINYGRETIGEYGVAISESGRYAFFNVPGKSWVTSVPGLPHDDQQYLVRRDLYSGEYKLASKAADGITPQPLGRGGIQWENQSYSIAADGRYVAYRIDTGAEQQRIFVHDLQAGTTWTSGLPTHRVVALRLNPAGTYLAFSTLSADSAGNGIREVYRVPKGGSPERVDVCLDTKSCGRGNPMVLGLSADGNIVIYQGYAWDTASPHYALRNLVVSYNVASKTYALPYAGAAKPEIYGMNFSDDGTGMIVRIGQIVEAVLVRGLVVKPTGTAFTIADSLVRDPGYFAGGEVSRGATKAAFLFPYPEKLRVYDRGNGTITSVPAPVGTSDYADLRIDLADNGSLVAWGRFAPSGQARCSASCDGVQAMRTG